MTTFLLILCLLTSIALAVFIFLKRRADADALAARQRADAAEEQSLRETTQARRESDAAIVRAWEESRASALSAQKTLDLRLAELAVESERLGNHYANEARRIHEGFTQQLDATLAEVAPLRSYADLHDAENEVRALLAEAMTESTALRQEADALLAQ